ncbi:MAG: aldo/keto reductase [Phycisphaeraceae bacterium]|nr:aldo/keto reductase [Phycisphaeraceae bacterium]
MQYRNFGSTGRQLSAIGYGGMPLSLKDDRPSEDEAIRVLHRAVDLGITLIDTADSYCLDSSEAGHNERLIGKAVSLLPARQRDAMFVATKGGLIRPERRWERDGSAAHLRTVCEQSLKNLRIDRISLYQFHRIDLKVPIEESLTTLAELQREGKIEHVGVSNFGVDQLEEAARYVKVVSVQNEFSPFKVTAARPVSEADAKLDPNIAGTLEYTRQRDIAFLCWCPLGGMGRADSVGGEHAEAAALAGDLGVTPQRLALAWELAQGPMVFPIPGARRIRNLEDSAAAAELKLTDEQVTLLNRIWGI